MRWVRLVVCIPPRLGPVVAPILGEGQSVGGYGRCQYDCVLVSLDQISI